jgi:hypothetical protein
MQGNSELDGIMNSLEYNRICQLTTRESYEVISQFAFMCGDDFSSFLYTRHRLITLQLKISTSTTDAPHNNN